MQTSIPKPSSDDIPFNIQCWKIQWASFNIIHWKSHCNLHTLDFVPRVWTLKSIRPCSDSSLEFLYIFSSSYKHKTNYERLIHNLDYESKRKPSMETMEPFRTFTVLLQLNFALFIQLEPTFLYYFHSDIKFSKTFLIRETVV